MSPRSLTALTLTALLLSGFPILPLANRLSPPAVAQSEPKAEADRLLQQGIAQANRSQFRAALHSWQQSLQRYRQLGDRLGEANSLNNLGLAYRNLGDFRKAIDFHQQSLAIAREIGNQQGEAASLGNLGNAYYSLGDFRNTIDFHQQSLAIKREIGDQQGEAASLGNLGVAYYSLGDFRNAIDFQQQSLAIRREIGDRLGEAKSLGNLGSAYYSLGDFRNAIEVYQKILPIFREIGNRLGEAASLGNLGSAYHSLGDFRKAIDFHQQSLTIAREIGYRQGEAKSLGNLGIAYDALGDFRKAIDFHQQSLAIKREISDRQGEAKSLGNLGSAYRNLGDYRKAIDFCQQSLAIAREIGYRQGEAKSLGNLGIAYDALGDFHKAIDFHQQSLAIDREIGDRQGETNSLGNLGTAYHSLGDFRKAIDFHQQSLAIAREIGYRQGEAKSLGGLGNSYFSLGDFHKAIDFQQQQLIIAREIGYRQGEATALNNLGAAFLHNNQLSKASRTLRQSLQLIETLWQELGPNHPHKLSFLEQELYIYSNLQAVLVLQDQLHQALEIAERGRTRALTEQMARTLQHQSLQPLTLANMQRLAVERNATLVEYSILPYYQILLVWVILPNGTVSCRAIDLDAADGSLADLAKLARRNAEKSRGDSDLTTLVRSSRQVMETGDPANALNDDPLQQLYQILIQPIADLLPEPDSHIIFIPHQELFLVPFAALKDEQYTYLIEQYAISTAPSLQALSLAQQHRERVQGKAERALVVGNPVLPKQLPEGVKSLEPLPDAEEEAKQIARRFGTQPLIGAEATETAVVQQLHQARIIHLATHGLALDPPNPFDLSGRIALAPSGTDDGWLTATELVELTENNPLNAEMVVLSACDTGLGRVTGDGILGLSRALIVSGVPTIVVSLWQVPDDSAQFLMEQFYEALETSDNRAHALRKAMLQTMKVHEGPADWAAFTLVGEVR